MTLSQRQRHLSVILSLDTMLNLVLIVYTYWHPETSSQQILFLLICAVFLASPLYAIWGFSQQGSNWKRLGICIGSKMALIFFLGALLMATSDRNPWTFSDFPWDLFAIGIWEIFVIFISLKSLFTDSAL